jgi:hypothetical protein
MSAREEFVSFASAPHANAANAVGLGIIATCIISAA